MKHIFIFFSTVMVFAISSCSVAPSESIIQTAIAKTQIAIPVNTQAPIPTNTEITALIPTQKPTTPIDIPLSDKFNNVSVQVVGKNILQQSYSEFIELPFVVNNNYDKDIKGIQGILHIKDMFGSSFLDLKWDITSDIIPAHDSISIDRFGLEYNQFIEDQKKLYSTPFENLSFEYEFLTVMFTDGTTIK